MALNLIHQTKLQFLRRLRDKYRAAEKLQACRLAHYMLALLDGGDVSMAQMLNAWNMTQSEFDAKRNNKLQPRADKWSAHLAAIAAIDVDGQD